jgi:hypothetical protein
MALLAELICGHPTSDNERGRPFDANGLAAIRALAEDWGSRMLASGEGASRLQLATTARLAGCAPSVSLLPLLKRLLDENLRRYTAFREQWQASGRREGKALDECGSRTRTNISKRFAPSPLQRRRR